jgi:hypothetical protein
MSFGANASFDYKGFSLVLDFAGATMQSFMRANDIKIPFNSNGASTDWLIEDRWHRADPFDPNSAWIPGTNPPTRKDLTGHSNFGRTYSGTQYNSDFYQVNITYLRLRDLELGYNLPSKWLTKFNVQALRVYTNVNALFSLDNMKKYDLDPEVTTGSGLVMPQTRTFNFGFTLTL